MEYKVQLDVFDFRQNKFWLLDDSNEKESIEDIKKGLLFQLDQLESGILNQQDMKFTDFTKQFQILCYRYPDNLSELIQPRHVDIIFESLISLDSFDHINQLLDVLFEIIRDDSIKIYLYNKNIFNIVFQLYYNDESYFIPLCKFFSAYFINTSDEIHRQILKYKDNQHLVQKKKAFFKEVLKYAKDINPDNKEFAHSALYLLSNIINNVNLDNDEIKSISDILIDRLNSYTEENDLNDIIYCFCCLIKHYPEHIIIFSQTKVIWHFPHIFEKTQDENEFIRYLIFLQHLLSCDGPHIRYFIDQRYIFPKILERISNISELSENSIISSLKALYFGIKHIPDLVPILIENNILNLLEIINQEYQFSIKEIAFEVLNAMLGKSDEDSALILINSQIINDILYSIDQFSIEFFEYFFNNLMAPFMNASKINLQSINTEVINAIQELASSENEILQSYAQKFLDMLSE